jgi:hypothetical protein
MTTSPLDWLRTCPEPAVGAMAGRDLAGERTPVTHGPWVRALTAGLDEPGHPYRKWGGAHWRLVSLVELEAPASPDLLKAADRVLTWLTGPSHRKAVRAVNGLTRRCASQEGNALAVCCRLGLRDDPRVALLAESLVEWQWPDGGWNCDPRAIAHRSSFHETLPPMWGLHEYGATDAARRAAELFLNHRIFRRSGTGGPIHPSVMHLRYPAYWHYGLLQALLMLSRMGLATDQRAADALDEVASRRLPDGRWRPSGYWWRAPDETGSGPRDVVDWGRDGPNYMITLNALRVLRAAGRPM